MRYLNTYHSLKALKILQQEDPFLGLLSEILFLTGRRIGEVLSLSFSQTQRQEDSLLLTFFKEKTRQTKNRYRSTIDVQVSLEIWRKWNTSLEKLGCPCGRTYVFSRKKRDKEKYGTIHAKYSRLLKRLSKTHSLFHEMFIQDNNRFHIWRHSYAYSLYHDLKYDLSALQEAMGHESVETTKSFYGDWFFPPEKRFLDRNILEEKYNHLGFCNNNII